MNVVNSFKVLLESQIGIENFGAKNCCGSSQLWILFSYLNVGISVELKSESHYFVSTIAILHLLIHLQYSVSIPYLLAPEVL